MKIQPNVLLDLHKNWTPHPGQVEAGRALFQKHKKLIFLQCGRKWGKTDFVIYCLWRWCNSFAKQTCYYIAPFATQAKEIIWASGRIQEFGPTSWIKKILINEMRVIFWNDSFVKVCGADNQEALRGPNPNFVVYEENKDFPPTFHQGFGPNLLTNRAPLVAIGTPPENDAAPSEIAYFNLAKEAQLRDDGYFRLAPSWERNTNPEFLIDLERTRKILVARGDEDIWLREYGAQFVRAGKNIIFPMLSEERHKRPLAGVLQEVHQNEDAWEFWCVADPGSGSVFAVGFFALNRYIPKIYMLSEIYAQEAGEMSVGVMYPKIEEKLTLLSTYQPGHWYYVYDEAALWFLREVNNHHVNYGWMPSHKAAMRGDSNDANSKPYLSMLKDLLNEDVLIFSDDCPNAWHEFQAYQKDKNGNIPKKNDHCIDFTRYLLHNSSFTMIPTEKPDNRILSLPRTQFSSIQDNVVDNIAPMLESYPMIYDY